MPNHLHYGDNLTVLRESIASESVDLVYLDEEPGFAPVPRLQIVTNEQAMTLRERAVHLPARREDTFKRAAREEDTSRQTALDL